MTTLPELAALRSTNAVQAEVIAQLRADLAPARSFHAIGRFSLQEEVVLSALMRFDLTTLDHLYHALYADRYGSDGPDQDIIKVLVCGVRRKVAPHGATVETWYKRGYRMAPECKAKLRAIMTTNTAGDETQ